MPRTSEPFCRLLKRFCRASSSGPAMGPALGLGACGVALSVISETVTISSLIIWLLACSDRQGYGLCCCCWLWVKNLAHVQGPFLFAGVPAREPSVSLRGQVSHPFSPCLALDLGWWSACPSPQAGQVRFRPLLLLLVPRSVLQRGVGWGVKIHEA